MFLLTWFVKPLFYLSPIIFVGYAVSPTCRYYLRVGMFAGCLSMVGVTCGFIAAGMSLAGMTYDVNYVVGNSFYWLAHRVLDITIEVEGEEHLQNRPAVMVGNHQSMLDILWLGRYVLIASPPSTMPPCLDVPSIE